MKSASSLQLLTLGQSSHAATPLLGENAASPTTTSASFAAVTTDIDDQKVFVNCDDLQDDKGALMKAFGGDSIGRGKNAFWSIIS